MFEKRVGPVPLLLLDGRGRIACIPAMGVHAGAMNKVLGMQNCIRGLHGSLQRVRPEVSTSSTETGIGLGGGCARCVFRAVVMLDVTLTVIMLVGLAGPRTSVTQLEHFNLRFR